ncbi:MAG: DUF4365 domain-containing protein [Brachybacterium sp.]|nr:DUF4365 domain-containing protein [Brachybacterium sp.]
MQHDEMGNVMLRKPSAKVGSQSMTHAQLAFEDELGWIFRPQPTEDFGIDAHAEIVDGEDVRGRLLALQVKGGKSWFSEPTPEGWWFRPETDHVEYWLNHSLPVAVVLYHPETKLCHWQLVNRDTLVETSTGKWKILVPAAQAVDGNARVPLSDAAEGDPYVLRIRELRLAKPWMEMLAGGTRLLVDMEEWIHKSSGRGSISIGIDHENGGDPEKLVTWAFVVGPRSYADAVLGLFAWADLDVHGETYDDAEREEYEAECSFWDEGEQFFRETFEDWRRERVAREIRPYMNASGEVDFFRLELSLNDLGKSFLIVDQFAAKGARQLTSEP